MSKFYGTVRSSSYEKKGHCRGHHDITVVAQSYDGSIGIFMSEGMKGDPYLEVRIKEGDSSDNPPDTIYQGTFHGLVDLIKGIPHYEDPDDITEGYAVLD